MYMDISDNFVNFSTVSKIENKKIHLSDLVAGNTKKKPT